LVAEHVEARGHAGFGVARADRVDPNTSSTVFGRQRAAGRQQGGLGHRVGADLGFAPSTSVRCDGHDRTARGHQRRRGLCLRHRNGDVDPQHFGQLGRRGLVEAGVHDGARIEHHAVQHAEVPRGLLDDGCAVTAVVVGDVGGPGGSRERFAAASIAAAECHPVAGTYQGVHDRLSDCSRPAADQHGAGHRRRNFALTPVHTRRLSPQPATARPLNGTPSA